jgi:hypothetical protein
VADDVRVDIDLKAIDEMARRWDSPVGEIIRDATSHVEDTQRILAPASLRGSRYSPPGHLKRTIREAEPVHFDDAGYILGLSGTATVRHGGSWPYALAFISNDAGRTANRGRRSYRRAENRFIENALNSLDTFVGYAE